MNCREIQSKLLDYIDCYIEGDERDEITRHLESCDSCKRQFLVWQETITEIQKARQLVYEAPQISSVKDRVMMQIEMYERNKKTYRRNIKVWNRLAAIAAAFAIMFVGYAGYTDVSGGVNSEPIGQIAAVDLENDQQNMIKKEDVVRIASNEELESAAAGSSDLIIAYSLGGVFAGLTVTSLFMRKRSEKKMNESLT